MVALIATTVIRRVGPNECSGYVYTIDDESLTVTGKTPIVEPPYRELDVNPLGGLRGGRGIAVGEAEVWIANNSAIFCYGTDWKLKSQISHPNCACIHDIALNGDDVWVTSSSNDLVLCFDRAGDLKRFYYVRDWGSALAETGWRTLGRYTQKEFASEKIDFRDPSKFEINRSDGAHVNGIDFLADGSCLLCLGLLWSGRFRLLTEIRHVLIRTGLWKGVRATVRGAVKLLGRRSAPNDLGIAMASGFSAIVRLDPDGRVTLVRWDEGARAPAHSVRSSLDGTAVFLRTSTGEVVRFDSSSGETINERSVGEVFLRGCGFTGGETLVVGDQQDLCIVDRATLKIRDRFRITDDSDESVYDVRELPREFGPLPAILQRP